MTKIKVIYVANLGREKGYRFIVDGELDPVVINEPLGRVKSALKSTYKPGQLIVLNHNEVMRIGDIREAITNHLNAPIKVIAPAAKKEVEQDPKTPELSVDLISKEGEDVVDPVTVNTIKNKQNGSKRISKVAPNVKSSKTKSMKNLLSRPRSRKAIKVAKNAFSLTVDLGVNVPGQTAHTLFQTVIDTQQKINDGIAVSMGWANMHNGRIDWTAKELHDEIAEVDKKAPNAINKTSLIDDVHIYAKARLLGVYAEKVKLRTDKIQDKAIDVVKTPIRLAKGAGFMVKQINEMGKADLKPA